HNGPFFHGNVASQRGSVGEDHMISNNAVMRHVGIGHDQRVIPDASQAAALYSSAVDSHEFANCVVIADLKPCGLALIADVLRTQSDGRKWKEAIVGADHARSVHRYVRDQFTIVS